jgi:hypothetical protein
VNVIFLVQHPEKGLIGFQVTGFEPEGRVFSAQLLVASSDTIGFSSGIFHQLPFVASSRLHVAPGKSTSPGPSGIDVVPQHSPSDPTKTAPIKEIPRAVGEVLFAGMAVRPDMFAMNRALTHFYAAVASNQWELPGEEESYVTDARIHVAIPKSAAIMLLNVCWVPLGHFRT